MAQLRIKGFGIYKNVNSDEGIRYVADQIGDALSNYMITSTIQLTDENGPKIAAQISKDATQVLRQMMPSIATTLINRWNGSQDKLITGASFGVRAGSTGFIDGNQAPAIEVNWRRLQDSYLKHKQKRDNPNFFYLSGALQKVFLSAATSEMVVRKLGTVNAAYISNNIVVPRNRIPDKIEFGRIEVTLMPGRAITASRFGQALQSGVITNAPDVFNRASAKSLDKYLFGEDEDIVARLQNKGKPAKNKGRFAGRAYRPLLQPAIAVYLLHRIPMSIRNTLSNLRSLA